MKASIYSLWWNPWGEEGINFENTKVSISVDNLSFDQDAEYKILFLAEPYAIAPEVNESAMQNAHIFDKIYTFNQKIIDNYSTAELFPWGSSWINFNNLKLNKNNHITFVTSSKSQTPGHELRLKIYDTLDNLDELNGLEIYQHKSPPFHHERNDFFERAKFHICVENSIQHNYFTEKIIDCFASKTIPIYYGCPNLSDWFDMNGVISFETLDELDIILNNLTPELYDEKLIAIENNFNIAKQFYGDDDVVPRLTKKITKFVNCHAIKRI
jgi:hypothetical protein